MASADVHGLISLLSNFNMLCTSPGTPEESRAAMTFVKHSPFDALPDDTEFNDAFFNNTKQLCLAILRPYLEARLLAITANLGHDELPELVFGSPLAACRVMKHIAMHESFPSGDVLADYGAIISTISGEFVDSIEECAIRRGVPDSDCLGAVYIYQAFCQSVFIPRPGEDPCVAIVWSLDRQWQATTQAL
jgi:hypothetical protein